MTPSFLVVNVDDRPTALAAGGDAALVAEGRLLRELAAAALAHAVEDARAESQTGLRASETRYRLLFETQPRGIVHQDATGQIIAMNSAAEQILGKTHEEFLGLSSVAVEHDTLREDATPFPGDEHPAMVALRTGRTLRGVPMQVWNPRRGEFRLISIDAVPLCWPGSGEPYEVYTTFEDVTEHQRAERLSLESAERLRLAMRTASMFAFEWDLSSDAVVRSADCGPILGVEGEQATRDTGEGFFAKVHPEDRGLLLLAIRGLSPEQPDYNVTYRCLRAGREPVALEERGHGVFDAQGRLVRLIGMTADASEKERRVRELRESEQRFRDLANSMPQLVWTAGSDGGFDYQNSRLSEYRAARPEPSAASDPPLWLDSVHPDEAAAVAEAWRDAVASGEPLQVEHRMAMADGSWRWHLSRAIAFEHRGGSRRWFGTATDIHDRKQAEESLRLADRRKDEFIALLGHELRNPLAPMRNAVHLMRLATDNAEILTRARDMVDRQVGHMTRLIDDLLDVSRISRGQISLKRSRVDLAHVVETAAADMESSAAQAGLRLECRVDGPAWVHGDEPRLRQVLTNLLHNAIKFTDPGGLVRIALEVRARAARVEVSDTGHGLEPEQLEGLFVPFSRPAEGHGRSHHGGLGLGLALVKGLVELHGGTVSVSSAGRGRGAAFTIQLALDEGSPAGLPLRPPPARARRRRILVIEDNPEVASSMQDVLALHGHDVHTALSGGDGLRLASELAPEVVLCDLGLPDLTGYEVARALRSLPAAPSRVLLIAISGYGQEEDRRRALDAGFDHHMVKPADPEAIERLLGEG
jgi:PAS domain S-box-containing protein